MSTEEAAKREVIATISNGQPVQRLPKHKVRIANAVVHIRYRTNPKGADTTWSFNVNPNTLVADYELWICGSAGAYYLIPIEEIKEIYEARDGYVDYQHPEIRVLDINSSSHECQYGRNNLRKDFHAYFRARLP